MLSTEEIRAAVCGVISEQEYSRYKKQRLYKWINKQEDLHKIDIPPEWAWRICASRLIDGHLDWWGWEARSDVIWDLCNIPWQFPRWNGLPCRLYLVAEQGIGDELLFSNAYGDLIDRNPDTVIEVDSRLIPALERTFGEYFSSRWVDGEIGNPVPLAVPRGDYDAFMPCGNALKLVRETPESFPGPWIVMDAEKQKKWFDYLDPFKRPYIGVSWTGRQGNLDPKIFPEGSFNLNYDGTEGFHKPHFEDFDDMWHFVSVLDEVHTVTNTTCHMSGSLGIKTKVIKAPAMYGEVNNLLQWHFGELCKWLYPNTTVYQSVEHYHAKTKERVGSHRERGPRGEKGSAQILGQSHR